MKTRLKNVARVTVINSTNDKPDLWVGDLLVFLSKGGYRVVEYVDEDDYPQRHTVYRIRPFGIDGRMLKAYLEWMIGKRDPAFYVEQASIGFTSTNRLNELELFVPSPEESEHVANLLEAIEKLQEMRRQQDRLFAELVDSIMWRAMVKGESLCPKQTCNDYSI